MMKERVGARTPALAGDWGGLISSPNPGRNPLDPETRGKGGFTSVDSTCVHLYLYLLFSLCVLPYFNVYVVVETQIFLLILHVNVFQCGQNPLTHSPFHTRKCSF